MYRSLFMIIASAILCLAQVSTQGLIAWYPFNGNANNMAPGSSLILPYISSDPYVPIFTKALSHLNDSNAMKLRYTNGLYGNTGPLPTGAADRTISVWVWNSQSSTEYPDNIITYGMTPNLPDARDPNPGKVCRLSWGAGGVLSFSNGTDSLVFLSKTSPRVWTNITTVIQGNTTYGYINGTLNSYKIITTWNTEAIIATKAIIGGRYAGSQTYYGAIDDIAIYNRALSTTEVAKLYNAKPYLESTPTKETPQLTQVTQLTQPVSKPYTVLANGQVVQKIPGNLRRLFNLFK